MIISKGFEIFDENTGCLYRILDKHFSDFYAEVSETYDEETEEFVNFKKCFLTVHDIKSKTKAKTVVWEE